MTRLPILPIALLLTLAGCGTPQIARPYETKKYVPEELAAALASDNPADRADAAEQILAMEPDARKMALIELTGDPKPGVRLMAVGLLGKHHAAEEDVVATLADDVMLDADADVRVAALAALAESGRPDGLAAISAALMDDPALVVRREAASLLDRLTGQTTGAEFTAMVDDALEKADDAAMAYDDWIETNREKLRWDAGKARYILDAEVTE
ncbi:MAG: hypothetical protein ABFS86_04985 [Planctomycetota bacterium]